jgi:hypothetical protein
MCCGAFPENERSKGGLIKLIFDGLRIIWIMGKHQLKCVVSGDAKEHLAKKDL